MYLVFCKLTENHLPSHIVFRFQLFGIQVSVLPWFWITMALLGSNFATSSSEIIKVILFVIAGFTSILIHELGHALTVKAFKQPTEIVLQAFGGFATYPLRVLSRKQEFLVAAAGPALQIAFGVPVFLILNFVKLPDSMGVFFLLIFTWISLVWAVFNLIPVYPLDGGKILDCILGPDRRKITHGVSIALAVIAAIYGLKVEQPFIAIFMGFFAVQNFGYFKNPTSRP